MTKRYTYVLLLNLILCFQYGNAQTFQRIGNTNLNPSNLKDLNGTLFFSGFDALGQELWKSDGTNAGTNMFKDLAVGAGGTGNSFPQNFVRVGNDLYFLAYWGELNGYPQIGKTDGTVPGTLKITSLFNPITDNPMIGDLTESNGKLFFTADAGVGRELYMASGNSYALVKDINPTIGGPPLFFPNGSIPQGLADINGTLYFRANDGSGFELWKSDGTDAGTVMVKNINSTQGSEPYQLTNVNGTLFFGANDGDHGPELWKSDGTSAGTEMIKDINPGPAQSFVTNLINVNGMLFFTANDGVNGNELWKSDGTAAGTVMIKDIVPGPASAIFGFNNVVVLNNILYFAGNDITHGEELWRSDGTEAGTYMIKDIRPGPSASSMRQLIVIGNRVYFAANDGINGLELWTTDGTTSGTVLVQDFNPGSAGSNINNITQSGGNIFLIALDNTGFNQLYVAPVPADAPLPVNLITFGAHLNDKDGVLNWKTSSEVNTSSFEIERSLDARTFSRVGSSSAAGNTSSFTEYQFVDPNITLLNSKAVYYRLKMVDQDGSFSYSSIVVLNISSKNSVVILYPNPAREFITLMISTRQKEKIQYNIVDATGRVVKSGTENLQSGSNNVNVSLTGMASGVYTVVIEGKDNKSQYSFIKQ